MRPILDNLQVPATIPVLKRGAGLFHATKQASLVPILRDGILPMGRAASMYSLFYHMDEAGRNVGMQRFKSDEWDCVVVIDVELLEKH
eukprot:6927936-Lingulodinium_polyedra.AAC.1